MNRIFTLIVCMVLLFAVAGCGNNKGLDNWAASNNEEDIIGEDFLLDDEEWGQQDTNTSSVETEQAPQDLEEITDSPAIEPMEEELDVADEPVLPEIPQDQIFIDTPGPIQDTSDIEPEMTAENIQKALANAGFYTYKIDGKIGPKTRQAIRDFQKSKELKVDGVVGPNTWGELRQYLKD